MGICLRIPSGLSMLVCMLFVTVWPVDQGWKRTEIKKFDSFTPGF